MFFPISFLQYVLLFSLSYFISYFLPHVLPYFLSYSLPYFLPQCCPYFFPIFLSYVRPHYQAMGFTTEANLGCFTHWNLLSATCSAILVLKSGFFNLVVAFN